MKKIFNYLEAKIKNISGDVLIYAGLSILCVAVLFLLAGIAMLISGGDPNIM